MSGPLRGAIVGAAVYEGLAADHEEAERMAAAGEFEFGPCHERGAVGPMAGVVSPSMPMCIVENATHGNRAFCTFNEGLGKVLRYGANDATVLERLAWIRDVLARVFARALERLGEPVDLRAMTAQALQMGDEGHNRNRAGTSLLLRELLPVLVELDEPTADVAAVARFINGNDHFFLNLTMPASKAAADAAAGVERSSIVTAMARNGTEFGVRLSGTGDRWFTGPSGMIDGLYLPGYGAEDANPDIGDSTITETVGLGGFSMAAAPAIVRVVGGRPEDAIAATEAMYEITWSESSALPDPGARLPRHAAGDRLPRGRPHRRAAVRQHRHRPPRARHRPDRRRAGQAADGGVRGGGARPGGMIAHRVAAPVLERAPARGVVAGVVRTAAYLELDGFVVAVTARGVPLMPNGVAVTDAARRPGADGRGPTRSGQSGGRRWARPST